MKYQFSYGCRPDHNNKNLLVCIALVGVNLFSVPSYAAPQSTFTYTGTPKIIDGDTLRMAGTDIRLLCLDAVELKQTCRNSAGKDYPCGEEAKAALSAAIGEENVSCRGTAHDKYGRPLAQCTSQKHNLSRAVIAAGWALSTCKKFHQYEAKARAAKLGIWQGEFEVPRKWRQANPRH